MKKLVCFMLILFSVLISVSCTNKDIELKLDKEQSQQGQLFGEVVIKTADNECDLFFGDESGNLLQGYTKIGTREAGKSYVLNGLVIPPDAKSIVAQVQKDSFVFCSIPEEYLLSKDDAFVFGALSDIHYNKYKATGDDDAVEAFDRALDYFENIGADMVGVTGDISNNGEESALVKFNDAIKDRSFPVFTVVGNHDIDAYEDGTWKQHISDNVKGCEFAENGVDFMYAPKEMNGDVFVFLNLTDWSYSDKYTRVVYPDQLNWLKKILEAHKENQVYIFFHLFMCGPDGKSHTGVGNIMNPGGYTYPLPFKYANADERVFRKMMKEYKNAVYLSGHSHWMFEMEKYGEQANYSNFDGEFCHMVHVPSVTEPRWIGENDTERTGKNGECSEGWVIYDYGDTTVLVPMDFISGTYYTEYMEIIYK